MKIFLFTSLYSNFLPVSFLVYGYPSWLLPGLAKIFHIKSLADWILPDRFLVRVKSSRSIPMQVESCLIGSLSRSNLPCQFLCRLNPSWLLPRQGQIFPINSLQVEFFLTDCCCRKNIPVQFLVSYKKWLWNFRWNCHSKRLFIEFSRLIPDGKNCLSLVVNDDCWSVFLQFKFNVSLWMVMESFQHFCYLFVTLHEWKSL